MYRLKRLCSRNEDFKEAIKNLQKRCHNSGYDKKMVDDILKEAHTLKREIHPRIHMEIEGVQKIRWVTLSKSCFEKEVTQFINRMNLVLKDHKICFEAIKSTAPNIGSFLFNNFDKQ